ncbi:hypothetical protein B0H16DRAFT_1738338 [Mycena metata]|uniref:Uncharacterized protein n=1 Tax=Mycena metata TaxID=1033252 RepID=A0AAD7H279_9AGAR|nr:hypothetical protein B0H16DRAFT_1745739 [Mycena metata]KAJ7721294.1 hypothetical protein B0H16DRAFT_1738338 [Mycena metata]
MSPPHQNGIVLGYSQDNPLFRACSAGLFPSRDFKGIGRYEIDKLRGRHYYLVTTTKKAYVFTDKAACDDGKASLKEPHVIVCHGLVDTAQEIYSWCFLQHNHGQAERRSSRLAVIPDSGPVSPWLLTTYKRGAQFHPWIPPIERTRAASAELPKPGPRKSAREHVKQQSSSGETGGGKSREN